MVLEISVAVIAAFIVIFTLALIPVLLQIKRTAAEAQKLLDTVRQQIVPFSHDFVRIVEDVRRVLGSVDRQVNKVEGSVDALKDTALKIRDLEARLQERVEQPLLELAGFISGLMKGLGAFFASLRRRG